MGADVPVPQGRATSRGGGTSVRGGGAWAGEAGREGSGLELSLNSISASSKWHRHCSAVFKDADNNDTDPWILIKLMALKH